MTKQEFLAQLRLSLSGLPQDDVEERLAFYSEIIDDRMEEGLSEADAVAAVGSVEDIASQITAEIPLAKIAKQRIKARRRLSALEIVLLALGFPIWFSLLVAAFSVVLSLYISLWAVVISLWAVFGSLVGGALGGILGAAFFATGGHGASAGALLGAAIVCAGLSIFMFFGCKAATKGCVVLARKMIIWIKKCLIRKEAGQ